MTRIPLIILLAVGLVSGCDEPDAGPTALSRQALGVIRPPLVITYSRIVGRLGCSAPDGTNGRVVHDLEQLPIKAGTIAGLTTASGAPGGLPGGSFVLEGRFTGTSVHLELVYDGRVATPPQLSTRLQVMDDLHATRSDGLDLIGTPTPGGTLDVGVVQVSTVDCELWRLGTLVLGDYHQVRGASPPAGQLRIQRWTALSSGTPYTFYDYVVLPTDFTSATRGAASRENTLFHEFAHTVRHVADGDEAHWNWDNFRWAYARSHDGTEIANVQYAFNEGWADYWQLARHARRVPAAVGLPASDRDWNELLVADTLLADSVSAGVNDAVMVEVLEQNPGAIHSLYEFETKLMARLGRGAPAVPASCPPDYADDGATCRRDALVVGKASYGRGVGSVPSSCASGQQLDAGLCYPTCADGYHPVGPVCWGTCPADYSDDGATCRRDPSIINADNSHCPWYDVCGLTFAPGCSVCPTGYANRGCTCLIDASIVAKPSYGRGGGTVPGGCTVDHELDAGLCYPVCVSGYHGVGPVCWGTCPSAYADDGATCRLDASIIVKY